MINLTEEYLKNNNLCVIEKIKKFFELDFYYASSFFDAKKGFEVEPPKKKYFDFKSAFVLMPDVKIKKIQKDYFDNELEISALKEIDSSSILSLDFLCLENLPSFISNDSISNELTLWRAGGFKDYVELEKKFYFNEEEFVKIPLVLYQYKQFLKKDHKEEWFVIKDLKRGNEFKEDKETFLEKIIQHIKDLKAKNKFKLCDKPN